MHVQLENNEKIVVNISDNKEYKEDNELIRLLHIKNISDYKIDSLLGKNIKLISNKPIYNRNKSAKKN